MSEELDWGDDPFASDMDFDSNFDGKPKSKLKSFASGFLSGATSPVTGDMDTKLKTVKRVLPKSFLPFFGNVSELNRNRKEVLEEIKNNTYEGVKDLQEVSKIIKSKMGDKLPNKISAGMDGFSQHDFSDWDGSTSTESSEPRLGLDDDDVNQSTNDLINSVSESADITNQTTVVASEMIADTVSNVGQSLLGVGTSTAVGIGRIGGGIQDLLKYQQTVQSKNDRLKINLLARTYATNAKYYKFMEAAQHRTITELKSISKSSAMSDAQKENLMQFARKRLRENAFNSVASKFGGIRSTITDKFGKDSRNEKYDIFNSLSNSLSTMMSMGDGMELDYFNMAGGMAGEWFINEGVPKLLQSKKGKQTILAMMKKNPKLARQIKNKYKSIESLGHKLSYGTSNIEGMANFVGKSATYGFDYEAEDMDYESYKGRVIDEGKKPKSKTVWKSTEFAKRNISRASNVLLDGAGESSGSRISTKKRSFNDLLEPTSWSTRSEITLNEVLPAYLSKINLNIEKLRTGDNSLTEEKYDSLSDRWVSQKDRDRSSVSKIFNTRDMGYYAENAKGLIDDIDKSGVINDNTLKAKLATYIAKQQDKDIAFTPYNFINLESEGFTKAEAEKVRAMFMAEFKISQSDISKFNSGNLSDILDLTLNSDQSERLVGLSEKYNSLGTNTNTIANNLSEQMALGNKDSLQRAGLLTTDGEFDNEKIWEMFEAMARGENPDKYFGDTKSQKTAIRNKSKNMFGSLFGGTKTPKGGQQPEDVLELDTNVFSKLGKDIQSLSKTLSGGLDLTPLNDIKSNTAKLVENTAATNSNLATLINEGLKVQRRVGKKSMTEDEEEKGRQSIIDKIKGFGSGLFSGGVDKVLAQDPLILGGLLGGLAVTAFNDPKTAALIAGGSAITMGYMKFHDMAKGRGVYDDEDLYEEGEEEPILESEQMKKGRYFCSVTKKVIKTWAEIVGGVVDKTGALIASAYRLSKNLVTTHGKRVLLSGLNKARTTMSKLYNWVSPVDRLKKMGGAIATRYHQMNVYVKTSDGISESPVLTRAGFKDGKYFNENGDVIKGWNEIKGPVYDKNGEELVSQSDVDSGLVTSTGMALDKLSGMTSKASKYLGKQFGIFKTKAGEKARGAAEAANKAFTTDLIPVVSSIDRIYSLLAHQFGVDESMFEKVVPDSLKKSVSSASSAEASTFNKAKDYVSETFSRKNKKAKKKGKIRENSAEDLEQEEAEELEKEYKQSFVSMMGGMFGRKKKGKEEGEKKSGLLGMLFGGMGSLITGGLGGIASGFNALFGFSKLGLKVLPAIATGIGALTKLMGSALGLGGGGVDIPDTYIDKDGKEQKHDKKSRKKAKNRAKAGGRFSRGMKGLGLAAGIGLGADALRSSGIVDAGSTTDEALGYASTAANIAGGVQMASSVAGMFGTSLTGLLGGGLTALGGVLSAPVLLGGAAIAAAGYGAYKLWGWSQEPDIQGQIRLAQYGINDEAGDLAEKVLTLEKNLEPFVVLRSGQASLSSDIPVEEIIKTFVTGSNKESIGEFVTWFNGRFKPVFLSYLALMDAAGIKGMADYDDKLDVSRYKVAKKSDVNLKSLSPFPYSVVAFIDEDELIMDRTQTELKVKGLLAEWKKDLGDKLTPSKNLNTSLLSKDTATLEERRAELQKAEKEDTFFGGRSFGERKAADKELDAINKQLEQMKNGDISVKVQTLGLNISDTYPNNGDIETFTALRVHLYGLDLSLSNRVESILYLERYCERFVTFKDGEAVFKQQPENIYINMVDIFGPNVSPKENWLVWFKNRFLPVFLNYVSGFNRYRRGTPGPQWKTLSATARADIGKDMVATKVKLGKNVFPIYSITTSPFKDKRSLGRVPAIAGYLRMLNSKATEAKLKDPLKEAAATSKQTYIEKETSRGVDGKSTAGLYNDKSLTDAKSEAERLKSGHFGVNNDFSGGFNTDLGFGIDGMDPEANYTAMSGDTSMDGMDFSGVKINPGEDKGVSVPKDVAEQLLMKEMLAQGFTDPREIALMLSNCYVEAGGFKHTTEDMNYRDAKRMVQLFSEVKTIQQAQALIKAGPVAIANTVYGGKKGLSLGNTDPNDGWLYRGRGFIHLTGKNNYREVGNRIGVDLVNNPKLASTDPKVMAKIAVDYYKNNKRMRSITENSNFEFASKGINYNLPDMDRRFGLYKGYLEKLTTGKLTIKDTKDMPPGDGVLTPTAKEAGINTSLINGGSNKSATGNTPPMSLTPVSDKPKNTSNPGIQNPASGGESNNTSVPDSLSRDQNVRTTPNTNDTAELQKLLAGGLTTSDPEAVNMLGGILMELRKLNDKQEKDPMTVNMR